MGRQRLPEGERKERITIAIKQKLIEEIKKEPGYNQIIEDLIEQYLAAKKNKD